MYQYMIFLRKMREVAFLEVPNYEEREQALLPITNEASYVRAELFLAPLMGRAFYAMLDAEYDAFHGYFSGRQFRGFLRGFGREEKVWEGEDLPGAPMLHVEWQLGHRTVQFGTNDTALEYEVTGEPIHYSEFCQPALSTLEEATYTICASDIKTDDPTETDVLTKCGHYFHHVCLNTWINRSALPNSNTCPSCRTELCRRRGRAHMSERVDMHDQDMEELTDAMADSRIGLAL
jgi:hypothetical protein